MESSGDRQSLPMTRDEALIAAFADELRSRRAALRLSQEELAHRAGVIRTYIAKLELVRISLN